MANNKIPLALGFDPATNVNTGLEEFVLNLRDVGDVCETDPTAGQALVYDGDNWCPGNVGAGTFSGNLSDVGDVCDNSPSTGQALVWSGSEWCPSTIPTGGGGGAVNSVNTQTGDVSLYLSSLSGVDTSDLQADHHIVYNADTNNWTSQYSQKMFVVASNPNVATLSKGDVVYVSDVTTGGDPEVSLALANSSATMPSIGVVDENIPQNQTGPVISFGTALNLTFDDTLTTADVGKTVYVSPTNAGQVTITKPTGSSELIQNVGVLIDNSPVKVKVTGVGRANDVPNSATFNGSVTVGTNSLTQSDAQLDGTTADHLVITNASNKISSVASSTLFTQGIADNNIATTPIPAADLEDTYVTSVNGETGASVTLDADDIGDAATNNKFATQTQLDKVDHLSVTAAIDLDSIPPGNLQQTYLQAISSGVIPANLNGNIPDGDLIKVNGTAFEAVDISTEGETFIADNTNIETLANVDNGGGFSEGHVLVYQSGDTSGFQPFASSVFVTEADSIDHGGLIGLGDDDHPQYVLASATRAISGTLSAIQNDTGLDTVYLYTDASGSEAAPILTFQRDSDNPDDGDYLGQIKFSGKNSNGGDELYAKITGKTSDVTLGTEDGLIEIAVKNAGSNLITTRFTGDALRLINGNGLEVDGTLDVTGATTLATASVTATPTTANHIANKSYVDAQIAAIPSYLQVHSSGTHTLTSTATEYDIGWAATGTYALSDPGGNLELDTADTPDPAAIHVSGDGVYQIDCTVQSSNASDRVGMVLRLYIDTGSGFTDASELRSSNYASRGTASIVTGSTHLNTLLSLSAGDKIKFTAMGNFASGTTTLTSNGTYLRIVKIA
jgi:hypothetical protein